ncbi:DUF5606 family protein [Flavicella sediminum]|uniref:DUF5606 family protein n=1 Tax=Flavicella sediminum TaxID=2585141 RepID=UPI001123020E|nr:DUF5606 domain-containing protein [Flavicella sediminum]
MGLSKTIAIAGKAGLFNIITQSKGGFIVESIAEKKKFPVTNAHNVSVLNDIAIYTYDEEKPLREVFLSIHAKEEGKAAISHKESNKVLLAYFAEILPDFDQERVYPSNIKKVIQWYNLLIAAEFDFSTLTEKEEKTAEQA